MKPAAFISRAEVFADLSSAAVNPAILSSCSENAAFSCGTVKTPFSSCAVTPAAIISSTENPASLSSNGVQKALSSARENASFSSLTVYGPFNCCTGQPFSRASSITHSVVWPSKVFNIATTWCMLGRAEGACSQQRLMTSTIILKFSSTAHNWRCASDAGSLGRSPFTTLCMISSRSGGPLAGGAAYLL